MTTKTPPAPGRIQKEWDAIATRYDRYVTPENMSFAEQALSRIDIAPGTRFLDVACGSGALSIPAARRGARVTAVDLSPTMIERLVVRARAEGLGDLEGLVMDAHALELDDDTFDLCASQNGVSLLDDLEAGLREIVRVTKPGGRVLIVAHGARDKAESLEFLWAALQAVVPDIAPPAAGRPAPPMRLVDPNEFHHGLVAAGLAEVRVQAASWDMRVTSGDHFWDVVTSGNPIAAQLAAELTDEQRTEVQMVLEGMLRERSGGVPGAMLHHEMNVGVGTKR